MFLRLSKNRAQSTIEYAILIGVIVAGLIAMQVYLKRGYQRKLKESADEMGSQFSPGVTTGHITTNSFTDSQETVDTDGVTITKINKQDTTRDIAENVPTFGEERWW
jgi:Flp pilus assembly pilin Flp